MRLRTKGLRALIYCWWFLGARHDFCFKVYNTNVIIVWHTLLSKSHYKVRSIDFFIKECINKNKRTKHMTCMTYLISYPLSICLKLLDSCWARSCADREATPHSLTTRLSDSAELVGNFIFPNGLTCLWKHLYKR